MNCPRCRTERSQTGKFWVCPEHGAKALGGLPNRKLCKALANLVGVQRVALH